MPLNNEILSRFCIPQGNNDYRIEISITGRDASVRQYIFDHVCFYLDNKDWIMQGLPINTNLSTTSRILFATSVSSEIGTPP